MCNPNYLKFRKWKSGDDLYFQEKSSWYFILEGGKLPFLMCIYQAAASVGPKHVDLLVELVLIKRLSKFFDYNIKLTVKNVFKMIICRFKNNS